jgi:hypothetical protein
VEMKSKIADRDLYHLFLNTLPSTLDSAIRRHGHAADNSAEELTFIVTEDINAMWLRDSAIQLQSYLPFLKANISHYSLAALFRGAINLQSRYIRPAPFCNAFRPPDESKLPHTPNTAAAMMRSICRVRTKLFSDANTNLTRLPLFCNFRCNTTAPLETSISSTNSTGSILYGQCSTLWSRKGMEHTIRQPDVSLISHTAGSA